MLDRKLCMPYFVSGTVTHGFRRGGTELGCPTANLPDDVADALPQTFECGVYCGWASVDGGPVYPMVMSVGYNDQFSGIKKTMEVHIMHQYNHDFYGSCLKISIVDFLRPMTVFDSLDLLIEAISRDKNMAAVKLSEPENVKTRDDPFFNDTQ